MLKGVIHINKPHDKVKRDVGYIPLLNIIEI